MARARRQASARRRYRRRLGAWEAGQRRNDDYTRITGDMAEREGVEGTCERVREERGDLDDVNGSDGTTTHNAPSAASVVPAKLATASPPDNHGEWQDFGGLPLIDVWVARGKGSSQEDIEARKS
jgi:hypothetical protein